MRPTTLTIAALAICLLTLPGCDSGAPSSGSGTGGSRPYTPRAAPPLTPDEFAARIIGRLDQLAAEQRARDLERAQELAEHQAEIAARPEYWLDNQAGMPARELAAALSRCRAIQATCNGADETLNALTIAAAACVDSETPLCGEIRAAAKPLAPYLPSATDTDQLPAHPWYWSLESGSSLLDTPSRADRYRHEIRQIWLDRWWPALALAIACMLAAGWAWTRWMRLQVIQEAAAEAAQRAQDARQRAARLAQVEAEKAALERRLAEEEAAEAAEAQIEAIRQADEATWLAREEEQRAADEAAEAAELQMLAEFEAQERAEQRTRNRDKKSRR